MEGECLGLPDVYLEWLCGDEEGASPAGPGMLLTKEYLEEIKNEMKGHANG